MIYSDTRCNDGVLYALALAIDHFRPRDALCALAHALTATPPLPRPFRFRRPSTIVADVTRIARLH